MDKYLVLGNPIDHSLSPLIHRMFAQQNKIEITYDKKLVAINQFDREIDSLVEKGFRGFNVTVPFKEDAFAKVNMANDCASAAQAVNTIKVTGDSDLYGFNTDGVGLIRDLVDRMGLTLSDSRILVIGAGGAAKGVVAALLGHGPDSIVVANRTMEKAKKLVTQFKEINQDAVIKCLELDKLDDGFDLIINSTSIGLAGEFNLLDDHVVKKKFCYDLAYGASARFASWARNVGALKVADGLGMLVEQAAESFFIWRGLRPETQQVLDTIRNQLIHSKSES
ncbi:MAG: shikimate dehydrogenase [Proteobacteria bacterium TMED261]|nr:MAG: shikimate dehydrogenase [Proteobacteria bacterium TMED261]